MFSLLVLLSGAVMTDFFDYRIPNSLIILGIMSGIAYRITTDGFLGIGISLVGVFVPIVLLFPVFLVRGMGAGDVKLLAVTGSYFGVTDNLKCLALAIILGAIISVAKIIRNRNFVTRMKYLKSYLVLCLLNRGPTAEAFPKYREEKDVSSVIHFSLPIALGTFLLIGGVWK